MSEIPPREQDPPYIAATPYERRSGTSKAEGMTDELPVGNRATGKSHALAAAAGGYHSFERLCARLASPFLLLIRLYWGWQFLESGWGKLHGLPHVIQYFASLNIPHPEIAAPCVALLEFGGGLFLIIGLATRLIGLLLTCNMLVAYLTADREGLASLFTADPGKFFTADPFPFLMASLIVLVFGAGIFSLDHLLARRPD